jgi:hypothetical protein
MKIPSVVITGTLLDVDKRLGGLWKCINLRFSNSWIPNKHFFP